MNRSRWWALLALMLLTLHAAPFQLMAQHTGGSFGGSRWGSGSSRSSSSRSGSSWSRGSSSRSTSSWGTSSRSGGYYGGGGGGGSYGSYSGGGGSFGGLCVCVIVLIIIAAVVIVSRKKGGGSYAQFGGPPPGPMGPAGGYGGYGAPSFDTFSLGALAIAFDATARAQIQAELDRIAQQMSSGGGLDAAARATGEVLARFLPAAYFVHHAVSEGLTMQATQSQFEQAVNTERGRFMIETVRGEQGGVRRIDGPKVNARVEEGGGFVAVTLLVARRGSMAGFVSVHDRASLQQALYALLSGGADMQAMEVVWVPSDPNDVMSSAEMAVVFPTFRPLAPDAQVGRRACAHCKSVYAAELGRCPSCGAPAA